MRFEQLQRVAVDTIKEHALRLAHGSRRAQVYILTEYLWGEEGPEQAMLARTGTGEPPAWLARLIAAQLADEHRHAQMFRDRIGALGATPREAPPLVRAKLWWLDRACAPYYAKFEAGPIVVMLAAAARFEATGVRLFTRHLGVLEAAGHAAELTAMLRSIVGDERRHARSCAAAAKRLVRPSEQHDFAALSERIATIDRAFGITLAVRYWLLLATLATRDRITQKRGLA
ncbi:MAG TPA: hypothetical protein VFQ65_07210 [Kofleriaceae bacterium]|nr:hypothetical protein [Kofleriaceae bacterium]